jgi:glycosyltransferase involved in cell wall biosynthesis
VIVSVIMITYAHENYICEAIKGILIQEVDFEVELIIADDNSPDNTSTIVKSFSNHPRFHWVKYTKHKQNKGMVPNVIWALEQATGKYIALCEGDDYWTDPLKLQKQVDFLEKNPEYGLVCGGVKWTNHITNECTINYHNPLTDKDKGCDITLESLRKKANIQTLTTMFKAKLLDIEELKKYNYFCDITLFYLLIKKQKGYYFNEILAAYNLHESGVFAAKNKIDQQVFIFNAKRELFLWNKRDEKLQQEVFHHSCDLFIRSFNSNLNIKIKKGSLFVDMLRSMHGFNDIKHILKIVLKSFSFMLKNKYSGSKTHSI